MRSLASLTTMSILALGLAGPLHGQPEIDQVVGAEYGTSDLSTLVLGPNDFHRPYCCDASAVHSDGYLGPSYPSGSAGSFVATLHLPLGAVIAAICVHYFDDREIAIPPMTATLRIREMAVNGTVPYSEEVFNQVLPPPLPAAEGYASNCPYLPAFGIGTTFRAVGDLGDSDSEAHPLAYELDIYLPDPVNGFSVTHTRLGGAVIKWRRQVSPAPDQATFSDVAPGSPGYAFVEALAAAGISTGCGNGKYCPDDPVTRRQLAMFLARAMGLHWVD